MTKKKKKNQKKKKNKALDCTKLEYYKETYHIIFLITQIPGQQCHGGDSLRT